MIHGWKASPFRCTACALSLIGLASGALADEPLTGLPDASLATSLPRQLADLDGRSYLARRGLTYVVNYSGEVFGIASGGLEQTATYDGVLALTADLDLERLLGWSGASLHASGFQIHGRGPTDFVGNEFTISNIEALPSTRLYELWLEQGIFADRVKIRFGQLVADGDLAVADTAAQFLNGTFGWPGIFGSDMPAGGPAYPLAAPGVRVGVSATRELTFVTAIYNGSPADPDAEDPEASNRDGLEFRLRDPPLVMSEAQYSFGQDSGLAGKVKLGGWYNFGHFASLKTGAAVRGDYGIYAVMDQRLYALPGSDDKGVSGFARISVSPEQQNLFDFYFDAGLTVSGFSTARPDDTAGVAFGFGNASGAASRADRDAGLSVARDYEAVLELDYQAVIAPGWTVVPDFQYVIHPGAHVPNPQSATEPIKDAVVLGLRTSLNY
jgi:porin